MTRIFIVETVKGRCERKMMSNARSEVRGQIAEVNPDASVLTSAI
jgi:hypothetical protein